ncbi:MAG: acyl-CoA dehydrogenase family protein [Egibacteraceae bacterium]
MADASSPDLSPEDRELRQRARHFVDSELIPHEVEAELNGGWLSEEVRQRQHERAGQLGLLGVSVPASHGGPGYSVFQQVLISEQIGRVTNTLGWVVTTPPRWLAEVATGEQLERWVVPTFRGERHECYAITEEHAGSDVDKISATATKVDDGYVLRGEKWHVTSANLSDWCLFQAKRTDGPSAGSHALFMLDLDAPGVEVVRTPAYSQVSAHEHPVIAFDDVRVGDDALVGREDDGMRWTHEWFRYERLMIAARCCGAAERLIDEATAFAASRQTFGRALLDHQAVAFMLADSLTELWAARLMTHRTAHEMDVGADPKLQHAHCSMVKLFASEMANRVADRAVQIFGGRGFMRENVAERFYRELRVDRIWEGPSEIQRVIIADQLRKRGVDLAR